MSSDLMIKLGKFPEIKKTILIQVGNDHIERIDDYSDPVFNRARVVFRNGYQLSIIFGEFSFGYRQDLFELAILNNQGEFRPSLFDEYDQGEEVLGYCNVEKVKHYIKKIGGL